MPITLQIERRMLSMVERVERLLTEAEAAAHAHDLADDAASLAGVVGLFFPGLGLAAHAADLLTSDTGKAIAGNTYRARPVFDDWSGARVEWVRRGKDDNGDDYTLADWEQLGAALASLLGDAGFSKVFGTTPAGVAYLTVDASVDDVKAGVQAAAEFVDDTRKRLKQPLPPVSWKVKAAAGGVVAVGGAVGLAYVWRAFK